MKANRIILVFLLVSGVLAGGAYIWLTKSRHVGLEPSAHAEQSPEAAVLAAYKLLEKAVQTGDGTLYLSLQSQRKVDEVPNKAAYEEFWKNLPADPSVRYEAIGVRTGNDHAAVLGKIVGNGALQFYLVKFVLEKGSWKIAEEETSEEPINISALEAAVPPKDGAFARSGSHWDKVSYATINTKWVKESSVDWRIQATKDESCLYIRFQGKAPLPAPGSEVAPEEARSLKGIPSMPDAMIIKVGASVEFELQVSDNPTSRATFDESGHATSNRYFMEYSLTLRNRERETLFSNGTNSSFSPLIVAQDQNLDVKLPLKSLGIGGASSDIEIRDANSPGKILPSSVNSFAP